MKIATIQVGELGFGGGIGDWYVYPENISTEELKIEVEDLLPFYDWVLRPVALPEHIDAEAVFGKLKEKNGAVVDSWNFDMKGKRVLLYGELLFPLAEEIVKRRGDVCLVEDYWNAVRLMMQADLVVCAKPISCLSTEGKVIRYFD